MIDTHCHLNDEKYENVDEIVNNYLSAGVDKVVCASSSFSASIKAGEIAAKYPSVYYTVGIHPDEVDEFDIDRLESLVKKASNKLVAIGEIGLDYFHNKENKSEQIHAFISQIELANKYKLPIVIHCREAYGDTLDVLKQHPPKYGAVMHCYSGSLEYARQIIALGYKLSFTGNVTFKNAKNIKEVAQNIPEDSFFLETDSPYLTPEPNRGKRNEPKNVFFVAAVIADLRGISKNKLSEITDKNAIEFYKFK